MKKRPAEALPLAANGSRYFVRRALPNRPTSFRLCSCCIMLNYVSRGVRGAREGGEVRLRGTPKTSAKSQCRAVTHAGRIPRRIFCLFLRGSFYALRGLVASSPSLMTRKRTSRPSCSFWQILCTAGNHHFGLPTFLPGRRRLPIRNL